METRRKLLAALVLGGCFAVSASVNAGARYYGPGAPAKVADLPVGEFREALNTLPDETGQRALQWLQAIEFTELDLNSMRVDPQGGIYYADRFVGGTSARNRSGVEVRKHGHTASSVLKLHSRPGAAWRIYLDVDGAEITDTVWNASSGAATLQVTPYDSDGKPGRLSPAEVSEIHEIWQRVAEDFAPFEVDVTTEDPGKRGPKTGWILVTHSTAGKTGLPEAQAGGVSYINTLGSGITSYYAPAFVYYNNLGSVAAVAEAASHGMGHLAGLSHDVAGTGTNVAWAPIMGLNHSSNMSQWSKGDYRGAFNPQDDVAILTGRMGLRGDDHDDSRYDKGTLLITDARGHITAAAKAAANRGVIEDRDDVDVFYFTSGAGTVDITVAPVGRKNGANLDIQVALYAAGGKRLARQNAGNDVAVRLRKRVPAGRYKFEVTGVGGNSLPHSDYGSLGQYAISGSLPVNHRKTASAGSGG